MGNLDVSIKATRDFVSQYNKLQDEYGAFMARLNGFDESQLNYTDFIDNFIDNDTVSDVSIDSNSNVSNKDIVTLEREMAKPHKKILAFNKIYYELQKKYGFYNANKWLKFEWTGRLYMHDGDSATFRSYCFTGDTNILTDKGIYPLSTLYGQNIRVLNKNHGWEDAYVQYFGKAEIRILTLERYGVTKHIKCTGNHRWFVKNKKGKSIYETDQLQPGMVIPNNTSKDWAFINPSPFGVAHGFFMGDGSKMKDRRSTANFCGDKVSLIPYFTPGAVTGTEHEYQIRGIPDFFNYLPSLSENKSYLYGWLSGYFAADGCVDERGRCTIASTNIEYLNHCRNIMCILGMPVNEIRYQDRISNLTGEMGRIYILTLSEEFLKDDFFIRPQHKERIAMNKKLDRKNRGWTVVSVVNSGMVDDVFCAVVPGSQSFTLDNNILTHNCFAYSLKDLAEKGLFFLPDRNSAPAKHLITFVDFIKEFVNYNSNRTSGAVGLPDLIPYMFYFWKKDVDSDYLGIKTSGNERYYADQAFQRFIYAVNQNFMRDSSQSAFTNTSVFDRPYFEALFGGSEFPDGTFMIDYEEEIIEFQKWYMKVMAEIRSQNMFTFPVSSISLLKNPDHNCSDDDFFMDPEFAEWAIKHNMKWSDSNLFIDDSVTSLSNCCFDGNQKVLTKSSNGVAYMTIRDLYNSPSSDTRRNFTIFHNGSWVKGKTIKTPKKQLYCVTTSNNKQILVTEDHLNVTQRGDVPTSQLTTEDYLMFSTRPLSSVTECDMKHTYYDGFVIGMYAGDGSMCFENDSTTTTVNFSLNKEKYEASIDILNAFKDAIDPFSEVVLGKEYNNVYPVYIRSNIIAQFIRFYVGGYYAFDKCINLNCLLQSEEFRRGIIDGYYLTDGGNSNRIYTSSPSMAECLEVILTSLGKQSVIDISDRTDEPVVIRGESFNRNFPLYCIRWYDYHNKRQFKDRYLFLNNCVFFKIKSIVPYETTDDYVYCFEMANQNEPYFTLPNGIITHNCRLKSDISNLLYFNSIGGSALKVGSVKVGTVNLARVALMSETEDEYLENLKESVNVDLMALDIVRHIIKRNVEKGILPNFSHGLIDFEHLYNTIGFIGIYETMKKFGYTVTDEFGNTFYTDQAYVFGEKIFRTMRKTADKFIERYKCDYQINTEQIPGESAADKLMKKDKFFYGDANIYDLPVYGNQFVPLGIQTTLAERVKVQAAFDSFCNGGSILHANIDTPFDSFEKAKKMTIYIARQGVTYFAFNTKIQVCKNNHAFYGDICPVCGNPVSAEFSRVVG